MNLSDSQRDAMPKRDRPLLTHATADTAAGMSESEQATYRIFGIKADGSRELLGEGQSQYEVTDLFVMLIDSAAFSALNIENESVVVPKKKTQSFPDE